MPKIFQNAAVIEWHYLQNEGKPRTPGLYLVASIRTQHRVFQAKFTPSKGWHLKNRGRYIYAWAMLPDYPPLVFGSSEL